jgi:predicted RNase H-like HicB family nuclease
MVRSMKAKPSARKISIRFDVVLTSAEEGGYVVSCPALPGCHSQGETEAEALANIEEAIEGWLSVRGEREARRPRTAART